MAAFLHRLTEKHDVADTEFFVDAGGYLTALSRHDLSGHLDYHARNHIEKWFQTIAMRIDLSFVLAGQSVKRETLAETLQILPQPPSTESSVGWLDSS